MTIVNFTPWSALLGGALIGLSAALLLLLKGRIAGISGIAGGLILPEKGDWDWRLLFILGLIGGGFLYQWLGLGAGVEHIQAQVSWPWLLLGGALVGVGTTIGSGCTSGHGICGLSRRSPRSLVATLTFMLAGFVVVYLMRSLFGGV